MVNSEKFKEAFLKFRRGGNFLKAFSVFMVLWFALRAWYGFDPDNSWLNLILSAEASVATALLLDIQMKMSEEDRSVMNVIKNEVEEIQADLEEVYVDC